MSQIRKEFEDWLYNHDHPSMSNLIMHREQFLEHKLIKILRDMLKENGWKESEIRDEIFQRLKPVIDDLFED